MDYAESLRLLRSYWKALVVVALIGSLFGSALAFAAPREFVASTQLFVATSAGSNAADLAQGGNYSQQQAKNYSNIVKSELVLQPVVTALSLNMSPAALGRMISTTVPLSTSIISVSVTDGSPVRAATIANSVMASLSSRVAKLSPVQADGVAQVKLQVIQSAIPPKSPSSPNVPLYIGVGLSLGLLLGAACIVIRSKVNNPVHSTDQVRAITRSTVIGKVEFDDEALTMPLLLADGPDTRRKEQIRQIRTNLAFLQPEREHKLLVVTSSVPNEGKSSIAANLAISLASLGKRVCLVDADLRKPSIARILDLDGSIGLTTVLSGQLPMAEAFQHWGPDRMAVLLAGDIPPNASELLSTSIMVDTIKRLNASFDVTIIDTPPVLPLTDGVILGQQSGGVILVVGSGQVNVNELKSSVELLSAAQTPILGTILNMAPGDAYAHYRGTYGYESAINQRPSTPSPDVREVK